MKTQLLYLDSHDDSASTLERLRWVQADRVVLVWPSHGRILHRRVDLALLAREATRQAAQLGILSHDPDVRASARHIGLPVFDDLDAISRQPWPAPSEVEATPPPPTERAALPARSPHQPETSSRRWTDAQRAGSMLLVIAALLLLSIVIGPAAVVELSPIEKDEAFAISVRLGEQAAKPEELSLPARTLQVEVDGAVQLPATGTVETATTAAAGLAVFTNHGQTEVILPEATGLRTIDGDPQRFETTERALVPAGIGSFVEVPIVASAAGPSGNVTAGSIGAIEGILGLDLTVTNPDPTSGGRSEPRPGVSQTDLVLARAALERQLFQSANALLQDRLAEGEALAPESFAINEVLDSSFDPSPGEASEVLRGSMTARITATAFALDRLQTAAETKAAELAGAGRVIVPSSVRVDLLPFGSAGDAVYQAGVRARSRPAVDFGTLARAIAGTSPSDAAAFLLSELELESPPRFRLWPRWWPWMPLLPLRIEAVWGAPAS